MSIPLDFYQILGAETHYLGDGIRRAYEARVSKPPQYGFSQDTLFSRRQFLQAACETLANGSSRRDYNQGIVENEEGTILTQVPWDKVCSILFLWKYFVEKDESYHSFFLPFFLAVILVFSLATSYWNLI